MALYFLRIFVILCLIAIAIEKDYAGTVVVESDTSEENKMVEGNLRYRIFNSSTRSFRVLFDYAKVTPNDRFVINVRNTKKCYVYVVNIDSNDKITILYPNEQLKNLNPVLQDTIYSLPPDTLTESIMYGFDKSTANQEMFYTFVSLKPLLKLENIIRQVPQKGLNGRKAIYLKAKIVKLYIDGQKNVLKNPDKKMTFWFKRFYSNKLTLIRKKIGEKEKGEMIRGHKILLIFNKAYYEVTVGQDGSFMYQISKATGKPYQIDESPVRKNKFDANRITPPVEGTLVIPYDGHILKKRIKLSYDTPVKYTVYIKKQPRNAKEPYKVILDVMPLFPHPELRLD